MMLILLLAVALVGVADSINPLPCQPGNPTAFAEFQRRHVVQQSFTRSSRTAWQTYLTNRGLCGRTQFQSFMEPSDLRTAMNICNGSGVRLWQRGGYANNLCISQTPINLYDITIRTAPCTVQNINHSVKYIIVACDTVQGQCVPAHFHGSRTAPQTGPSAACQ